MKHYLYRRGDGNEGNFIRAVVPLQDEEDAWAALAALTVNDYVAGCAVRRHIMRRIETEGEREFGLHAWVSEGPAGETVFGAAWLTSELQPLSDKEAREYRGTNTMAYDTLRAALDSAAWRYYRKNAKGA